MVARADLVVADGDQQRRMGAAIGVEGEAPEGRAVLAGQADHQVVDRRGFVKLDFFGRKSRGGPRLRGVLHGDLHRALSPTRPSDTAPSASLKNLSPSASASWRRWVTWSVVTPVHFRTWPRSST